MDEVAPKKRSSDDPQAEEEKLGHALVARGLITREEVTWCREGEHKSVGPEAFLKRLVKGGYLTKTQARRVALEAKELLNQQIPGFQLLEKLGQGAMGIVYKARQVSMDRYVAVKILHPRFASNDGFIERFTREAHLAAKFSSNNVVQAIDVGSAGPLHYFVMEYVPGTTIKDEIESKKRQFNEEDALDIVLQIAQALRQAHRRNLIHRDIKPANIMLAKDGIAKLADLGIARETNDRVLARAEKGLTIGTPYYIAPEQIRGMEDIDSRADIYSLGATLYHMVTGQPPFPGSNKQDVLRAHLKKQLTPPDHINPKLSSGLGEVIEWMLQKDRELRYQTPDDLIIDLECLLNGEPPKLAREKFSLASLQELTEGEEDEELEELEPLEEHNLNAVVWITLLAGLLALSLVGNIVQFFLK
ncbi:MAG: serine/threonine protein kinase [Gemmataceae bacterium]